MAVDDMIVLILAGASCAAVPFAFAALLGVVVSGFISWIGGDFL